VVGWRKAFGLLSWKLKAERKKGANAIESIFEFTSGFPFSVELSA
jgi:hypothetical protein